MEITAKDIARMSDAEVAELNARLGKQIVKKFFAFQLLKWVIIGSVVYAANRVTKDITKSNDK
jgi:hypothetical protein